MALSVPAPTRRGLAAASAALLALLAVLAVVASSAQAAPPTTGDPAAAAAGWLSRQFVDGDHLETAFNGQKFPDAGLTLDGVLGLAAAGVARTTAEAAMVWVGEPANLETYVGNGTTESFAGALAKLSLTAQVQGLNPTAFGSGKVDLLARLNARITASGRFTDESSFGDFSNGFSQSYAVLALARAGSVPPSAVSFLAGSACPDGGFPQNFGGPSCTPDTDTTALAVQAVAAAGDSAAAKAGIRWLAGVQRADGSFPDTGGRSNANSTGLAGQALRSAGSTAAAGRAAAYLRGLQSGCTAAAAQRGAIALDSTGFDASTAPRATTQALLGLSGPGLLTLDGTSAEAVAPELACAAPPTSSAPATHSPTPSPTRSSAAPATTVPPAPPTPAPTTQAVVPVAAPSTSPAAFGGTLPNTGASPLPVVWTGLGLLAGGTALVILGRRRRPAKP